MRFICMSVLAATLLLTLSGCAKEPDLSTALFPELVSVETVIDPQTGEITKLSHWEYPDGVTTTTEDRFKKDTPVTDRRADSRAPIRFAD